MDDRDLLEKAQTALDNTLDWERRYGAGINLKPIIGDLMAEVARLRSNEVDPYDLAAWIIEEWTGLAPPPLDVKSAVDEYLALSSEGD